MGVTDDGSIPVIVAKTRIKVSFKDARQFPVEVRNGSPVFIHVGHFSSHYNAVKGLIAI